MAGVIDGRLGAPGRSDQRLFERHIKPWMGRFFADLERAEAADFYARVGALGRVFMDIESEAFALAA
jgi:TorA maturation chaperone TorD